MLNKPLGRLWRRLTQPLGFVVFGLGGWAMALFFFFAGWMIPGTAESKSLVIQNVIHHAFRLFLWGVEGVGILEFGFEGADILAQSGGGLVIANHPTLLDVVLLISRFPQADCIVKKELWNNIFLRHIVSYAGYIPNDDGPTLVAAAMERVRKGRRVLIFPEGTRSLPEGLRKFNAGFAHIAVRTGCTLWPVVITCRPSALTKGQSVFDVPAQRPRLSARAERPLQPANYFEATDTPAIAARKVVAALSEYYKGKVDYGESERSGS